LRTYIRKADRGTTLPDIMFRAVKTVIDNRNSKDWSVRKIAKEYNIHYPTLSRYITKLKKHNKHG
jgi:DNA-binding IscR family transcriptional regulator